MTRGVRPKTAPASWRSTPSLTTSSSRSPSFNQWPIGTAPASCVLPAGGHPPHSAAPPRGSTEGGACADGVEYQRGPPVGGAMEPRIQYAQTADGVSIAYSEMGEGEPLVSMPSFPWSHI